MSEGFVKLLDLTVEEDAVVHLVGDDDKMRGFLTLEPNGPAPRVDAARVLSELASQGVVITYDAEAAIDARIAAFNASPSPGAPIFVAEGVPPGGKNGEIVWFIHEPVPGNQLPTIDGNTDVDLHELLTPLFTVADGEPMARIVPAVPGPPGRDIFGRVIPPNDRPPPLLRAGKNAHIGPDGVLKATAAGQPILRSGRASVEPVFNVKGDVDFAQGNVHFPGVVHVRREVLDGFVVEGVQGVSITGTVGAAQIRSLEGDVEVLGGMAGQGTGTINAHGHVRLRYLNHGSVVAGGDVVILKESLNAFIRAGGRVVATKIIGGTISARDTIECGTVGSPAGVKTVLVVGEGVERPSEHMVRVRNRIYAGTRMQIGHHVRHWRDDLAGPVQVFFEPSGGELRAAPWRR